MFESLTPGKKAIVIGVDKEFWPRIVVEASHSRGKKFIRREISWKNFIFFPTFDQIFEEFRIYFP